jgi:MFS family permease
MAGTIGADTPLPLIIVTASLVGASLGLFASSNMTAIMESVDPGHVGTASSMVATMRSSGRLVSATIIAIFLSYFMGDRQVTKENLNDFLNVMHTALYFFSALSLVGTFFSMVTGRPKDKELLFPDGDQEKK